MKRHPAIQQLSREHHHGLVLARRARRCSAGSAAQVAAAWRTIRNAYHAELEHHFCDEEARLLPRLRGVRDDLVDQTLDDHQRMRELALHGSSAAELHQFAELLAEHIRFEERTLFPTIEARLLGPTDDVPSFVHEYPPTYQRKRAPAWPTSAKRERKKM